MADRPKSPSEQKPVEVESVPELDSVIENALYIGMAAHTYTREQVIELIGDVVKATKEGKDIKFR